MSHVASKSYPSDCFTMKPKYRVEAFIVPRSINTIDELNSSNEIDDVKAAYKLKHVESESDSDELITIENRKFINEYDDIEEPIYDIPYAALSELEKVEENSKLKRCETLPLPKIPIRTSSLMSIDERGETDGILEEFCFHGYKHGCTAPAQRPEEVSEEIFKENWLRRLESLRERESILRDKESLLQERERLLFKKERELRILERLVKDKLKQADLYLKRCKSSQSIESVSNFDAKTRSSEGSRDSNSHSSRSTIRVKQNHAHQSEEHTSNLGQLQIVDPLRYSREETKSLAVKTWEIKQSMSSPSSSPSCEEKTMKNPPNSRSSLMIATNLKANGQLVKSHGDMTKLPIKNLHAASSAYSSLRCKPRPKMNYDDLDSTLSADIGDSSFVVTSGKFDPETFKKPYAFMRSASERRARTEQEKNSVYKFEPQSQGIRGCITEDKVLKRLSENIHISQDKSTKYLDYGLIDPGVSAVDAEKARHSYLNLERGNETSKTAIAARVKERPISWNEETNEWLQKKRQAYNLATKRIPNENFENKENFHSVKRDKLDKCTKKKDSKPKKFAIFR